MPSGAPPKWASRCCSFPVSTKSIRSTHLAGLSILGRVALITARYETPLYVPVRYPMVLAAAQEVVQQSYITEGRADSYNQDMVCYVAGEQFAYTATVNGYMMRERPAANIMMGAFYAESLLLAETGNAAGSIQIAGTAQPEQLPFFIAACDYTLMGEELFAASAYLSHEPLMLGGLEGTGLHESAYRCRHLDRNLHGHDSSRWRLV